MRRETVKKFIALEKKIAREKGRFVLFALFEREESNSTWDVVVSAPWLTNSLNNLSELARLINLTLEQSELNKLSRIVTLNPSDYVVRSVNNAVLVEHGLEELQDYDFGGVSINHAYIITSNPRIASASRRKTHHVVPTSDGWIVKKGNAKRASAHFDFKDQAVEYAREVSRNQNTELIIHGKNGKIQKIETP